MKTIFLDTEYSAPNCLLTGHLAVVDGGEIIEEYGFKLKHDVYTVNPDAIDVNGIDIREHHKAAIYDSQIEAEIRQFIKKHATSRMGKDDQGFTTFQINKLIAIGHGIRGDIAQIEENFSPCRWSTYVSRNVIDTLDLARAAELWGLLEVENIKLGTLAKHFGINHDAHCAAGDVHAIIQVYEKLKGLMVVDNAN